MKPHKSYGFGYQAPSCRQRERYEADADLGLSEILIRRKTGVFKKIRSHRLSRYERTYNRDVYINVQYGLTEIEAIDRRASYGRWVSRTDESIHSGFSDIHPIHKLEDMPSPALFGRE